MDDLLQFISEDKQEEFKTAFAAGYIGVKDDEALQNAVMKNQPVFDRLSTKAQETRISKFKEFELPGELEKARNEGYEKGKKEFAPKDETPEQKRIRELEEKNEKYEAERQKTQRRDVLREKYKDIDSNLASDLYLLEDSVIDRIMESVKAKDLKLKELENKLKYGSDVPEESGEASTDFDKMNLDQISAFARKSPANQIAVTNYLKNRKRP